MQGIFDTGMEIAVISAGRQSARYMEEMMSALGELEKYRQIGTVEECHEAMEKQKAVEPFYDGDGYADGQPVIDIAYCPRIGCQQVFEEGVTGWGSKYCPQCGQRLLWSL